MVMAVLLSIITPEYKRASEHLATMRTLTANGRAVLCRFGNR
jgi:hypothetical protein